ncbi:hypothetical protein [uncultured Campylobacter sp.]|uniref:hypothetical protein n=1 Tax=uncultured Campylobacter sp. TaxID=218934 RepID=UPI0026335DDB|nr:hypothetical protein [uncultured Campylobacter sp.]
MRNFNVSLRETPQNSTRHRILRGAEFHREILKAQNFIRHGILRRKIPRGIEFMEFTPPQIKRLRICSVSR